MIIHVAWRNIWRNPTRSLVVILAMVVGMFAGIFMVSFAKGMMKERLNRGIETEVSHIQIHHPQFREADELRYQVKDVFQKTKDIENIEGVNGVSPRIVIQAMVASAETGSGVKLIGTDPDREKTVSNLYTYIKKGKWFEGISRNPVVIGQKLADKLNVHVRSKIVLTFQDDEGNITSGAFRIAGIYQTVNTSFDETHVYVRFDDLNKLAALPQGAAQEIAVHLSSQKYLNQVKNKLSSMYPNLEVLTWKKLNPEFGYINDVYDYYLYVFIIIILLALGFGIVNTILMAILERVKELGMLMAIGMKKGRVFRMIMWESVMMSIIGGTLGVGVGLLVTIWTNQTGISFDSYKTGFEALGYGTTVHPIIDWSITINVMILVFVTGIVAAIYPALKALKLNPAEALRTE